MRFVGVDLSTKSIAFGVLVERDGLQVEADHREFTVKGRRSHDRLRALANGFKNQIVQLEPDHVFIEDISFTRNRRAELDLAEVAGAVKAHLYDLDIGFTTFNNSTVKAAFNLVRMSKEDVVAFIKKRFGIEGELSDNEADALMVALYGVSIFGRREKSG